MFFDAIISLVAIFITSLAELLGVLEALVVNCIIALVESLVRIFSPNYHLKRITTRKQKHQANDNDEQNPQLVIASAIGVILIVVAITLSIWLPKFFNREIEFYAKDGNAIPLALIIIQTPNGVEEARTDVFGQLSIPRFKTKSITIDDPRYIVQTWSNHEIEPELFVERSTVGKGLGKLTRKLLNSKN